MRTIRLKRRRAIIITALLIGIIITYFAWKDEKDEEFHTKQEHISTQDECDSLS